MSADGKVVIQTELDTKQADKQAKTLGGSLKRGIAKGAKVATGAMVAIGTASVATAGAMVKATKATMEYGVEVNRNSQKLNMSKQAYQEWSYVLKRSGTSIDSLKMGMKKISTAIDEAKNGSKSATENFKRLGISVQDLQGKSQEEVFSVMVEKLQGIKDTTERSAIANKFFGRSAQEMAGLLNKSGKEVDGLKKQAHDLGLVLSDDAIKKSAEFRGKITELQSAFEGLRNKMAVRFLPSLTKVTDGLSLIAQGKTEKGLKQIEKGINDFTKELNKMTPQLLKLGGTILKSLGKGLIDNLPTLLDAGARIIASIITGIAKALPILIKKLPQIFKAIKEALMNAFDILSKELPSAFGALAGVLKNIVKMFGGFLETLTSSTTQGELLRGILFGIVGAFVAYKIAVALATVATKLLTIAMDTNPIFLVISAIGALVAVIGVFVSSSNDVYESLGKEGERAKQLSKEYDELNKKIKDNAEQRKENSRNAQVEAEKIDYLWGRIKALDKVENKNKTQKKEMKELVKELNELVPELKLKYDEEKDALSKSTKAIEKNIKARKNKIIQDAIMKSAESIIQDRAEAQRKLNELEEEDVRLQQKKKDYQDQINKNYELYKQGQLSYVDMYSKNDELLGKITDINGAIETNQKNIEGARKNVNKLNGELNNTFQQATNIKSTGAFNKLIKDAKKAGVEIPQSLIDGFNAGSITAKEATTRLENAIKIRNLNKGVKGKAKQTVDDIVNAYLSGTISAEEASKQLRNAGLKGLEGGKGKAKKSGEEKRKNFKDGVEGTEKDKKDVKTSAKKGTVDQAKEGMKDGKKQATSSGKNVLQGFLDGLQNGSLLTGILNASKNLVDLVLGTIRSEGGEGSPWSTTTASGEFAVEGLIKGAKNKESELKRTYANVADTAIQSMDKQLVASSKYSAGTMQTALNTSLNTNLDGIPSAVVEGIENSNLGIVVDNRQLGRVVKGVL